MGQTEVADLMGAYLNHDPEVFEPNAATMLIRRAIGEGWDGKIFFSEIKTDFGYSHTAGLTIKF